LIIFNNNNNKYKPVGDWIFTPSPNVLYVVNVWIRSVSRRTSQLQPLPPCCSSFSYLQCQPIHVCVLLVLHSMPGRCWLDIRKVVPSIQECHSSAAHMLLVTT